MTSTRKNRAYYYLRKVMKVAADVSSRLPESKDGIFTKAVKVLGIVDSLSNHIWGEENLTDLGKYLKNIPYEIESGRNARFVDLFFASSLTRIFDIEVVKLTSNSNIIKASHPTIGTIHFYEHDGSTSNYHMYWYPPGFKFDEALRAIWGDFNGRMHLGQALDKNRNVISEYTTIPEPKDPLLGGAQKRLDEFVTQHRAYIRDGVPRTYLMYGKQGGGKTSFALRIANLAEGHVLRIDANSLTSLGMQEIDFLIEGLCPDFIIVDDIDRAADLKTSLPTLFAILTDFKGKHPSLTVILTINDIKELPPALLRPGRIDVLVEFDTPTAEEREEILRGYLKDFGIPADMDLADLVYETEGLTAAYLREVALQLRYRPPADVIKIIRKMNELAGTTVRPKEKAEDKDVVRGLECEKTAASVEPS
jgi:hypothetical protein